MDLEALRRAVRKNREGTVDLGDGQSVTFRRPGEGEMADLFTGPNDARFLSIELRHVQQFVVDWHGVTEASLLGPAVGSSDPVPFDRELWSDVVADRVAWVNKIADAILKSIVAHATKKAESEKN